MRYSLFAGGKRLRPTLPGAAESCGVPEDALGWLRGGMHPHLFPDPR